MRALAAFLVVGFCYLSIFGASAAEDLDRGGYIAATCAACHRLDDRDVGIPSIVGIEKNKLIEMMQTFRSDVGSNHIMRAVSHSLSDEEIAAVATYLAQLRKAQTP